MPNIIVNTHAVVSSIDFLGLLFSLLLIIIGVIGLVRSLSK